MTNQVITATQNDSNSVINVATGQLVGDAGTPVAYVLQLGFQPRKFKLSQLNGAGAPITYEYSDGMGALGVLKTIAAGTQSMDTADVFTIGDRSVTIPAGVLLASSTYVYEAIG